MYIYKITNLVNNKVYIGQTIQSPERRWTEHKRDLNSNSHCNVHLQSAWNKYGQDNFVFEVIDTASSVEFLNELEGSYIKKYKSKCYNFMSGGLNGYHSEETKKKISVSLTGKKSTKNSSVKKSRTRRPFGYPTVVDSFGNEYKIDVLAHFCKTHGLKQTGMFDLVNGKKRQYKGWHLKNTDLSMSSFDLIAQKNRRLQYNNLKSPNGTIFTDIKNISQFAKDNDLQVSNLWAVLVGKNKSHRGWSST